MTTSARPSHGFADAPSLELGPFAARFSNAHDAAKLDAAFRDSPELADVFAEIIETAREGRVRDDVLAVYPLPGNEAAVLTLRPDSFGTHLPWFSIHHSYNEPANWPYASDRGEQDIEIDRAYRDLLSWLGPASPLLDASPGRWAGKRLVVKVHEQCSWFLRFPLTAFSQLGKGIAGQWSAVCWIVTKKTLKKFYEEQAEAEKDLKDASSFLTHSVIFLNTYKNYPPECVAAAEALVAAFRLLREIRFAGRPERISLRWYQNASPQQVMHVMRDSTTRYVFAGFEAEGGDWETGDGPYDAWAGSGNCGVRVDTPIGQPMVSRVIHIDPVRDRLDHIRHLHAYHCFAAFDVTAADPAGPTTLVRRLLQAGARRVDGGITREFFLDFARALALLVASGGLLHFVLRLKAAEQGTDVTELVKRLDALAGTGRVLTPGDPT